MLIISHRNVSHKICRHVRHRRLVLSSNCLDHRDDDADVLTSLTVVELDSKDCKDAVRIHCQAELPGLHGLQVYGQEPPYTRGPQCYRNILSS